MKICVTGGAGFIGSHIVDEYLQNNFEVVVLDNLSSGNLNNIPSNIRFYDVDITDDQEINKIFSKEQFNIVNHHAAQINVRDSLQYPIKDAQINIIGGLNILEAARNSGVQKVIFASTGGAIYGETKNIPTSEIEIEKPMSPYGIAKVTFEKYLTFYEKIHNIKYVVLRYSNVYGPRQNAIGEAGVVSIFISKILSGETPYINGDGNQTRDFVFVEDVAKANLLVVKEEHLTNKTYNVSTGFETTINELFDAICRGMNVNLAQKYNKAIAGEIFRSCLDPSSFKKAFQWSPSIKIEEGLQKTIEFFKKNYEKNTSVKL